MEQASDGPFKEELHAEAANALGRLPAISLMCSRQAWGKHLTRLVPRTLQGVAAIVLKVQRQMIKMSLARPHSSHCSGHDLQLSMLKTARKNVMVTVKTTRRHGSSRSAQSQQQRPLDNESKLLHHCHSLLFR